MFTKARHAVIIDRIKNNGGVVANELAEELQVSGDTIRRDLRTLASAGICERVYGGAVAPTPEPIRNRAKVENEEKAMLGRAAARLVLERSLIFLDAGSTNLEIASALPSDKALTVATNSPMLATSLYDRDGISVIMIGGRIDPYSGACVGAEAISAIQKLRPTMAFIGACGVNARDGLSAFSLEEAQVKQAIAHVSHSNIVAVTAEKLSIHAPYHVVNASKIDRVITTRVVDECGALTQLGISVTIAKDA